MFRSKGKIDRLLDLQKLTLPARAEFPLTQQKIKLLENTKLLTAGEKIEIILVSLGKKLTTEINGKIPYHHDSNTLKELPDMQFIKKIDTLLQKLDFPYFLDHLEKTIRKTGNKRELYWFQICLNPRVKYFMQNYADELSEMEDGILYGYPLSAIRAFSHLIESDRPKHTTAADYFLAGIPSKKYQSEERRLYRDWWKEIKKISPVIVKQAEKECNRSKPVC